jgi:hypothetical protein
MLAARPVACCSVPVVARRWWVAVVPQLALLGVAEPHSFVSQRQQLAHGRVRHKAAAVASRALRFYNHPAGGQRTTREPAASNGDEQRKKDVCVATRPHNTHGAAPTDKPQGFRPHCSRAHDHPRHRFGHNPRTTRGNATRHHSVTSYRSTPQHRHSTSTGQRTTKTAHHTAHSTLHTPPHPLVYYHAQRHALAVEDREVVVLRGQPLVQGHGDGPESAEGVRAHQAGHAVRAADLLVGHE